MKFVHQLDVEQVAHRNCNSLDPLGAAFCWIPLYWADHFSLAFACNRMNDWDSAVGTWGMALHQEV